ncbi:MAG: hypothetical protein WCY19_01085 [Candidatus Gastranaerophilaceae bacterium]
MSEDLTLVEIGTQEIININSNFTEVEAAVNAKAAMNGDSTKKFKVADATEATEAINKGQLSTAVSAISADIAELETEIATKADKNGDIDEKFNVANATEATEAVNKGQLDTAVSTINSDIEQLENEVENLSVNSSVKFCMNSGNTTNGEADLLEYSGMTVTTKTGGSYANAVGTNAQGAQVTAATLKTLDMTGYVDGIYNLFLTTADTLEAFATSLYRYSTTPSTPAMNDIWLNTAVEPLVSKRYNGSSWDIYAGIYLGQVCISSGSIVSVSTNSYNYNGYNFIKRQVYDFGTVSSGEIALKIDRNHIANATASFALSLPSEKTDAKKTCDFNFYLASECSVTFPENVTWIYGLEPALIDTGITINRLHFETEDGGTTWIGSYYQVGCSNLFEDTFNRADEIPVSGNNGWTNTSSSNGQNYGWCLTNGYMHAGTTSGVTLNARLKRSVTYNASTTYTFKFKVNVTANCGISGFSPFGVDDYITSSSSGLYFDFAGASYETSFRVFNNGTLLYSNNMNASTDYWVEILLRPDSFVKFKYWPDNSAEPATYNIINTTVSKQTDTVNFKYCQYGPSTYCLKYFKMYY